MENFMSDYPDLAGIICVLAIVSMIAGAICAVVFIYSESERKRKAKLKEMAKRIN